MAPLDGRRRGPGRAAGRGPRPRRPRRRRGRGRSCAQVLDAVADAMPRSARPTATASERPPVPSRPRLRAPAARSRLERRGRPRPETCRSWCGSRCASRPTRRSWSPARCGWCCRSTTSSNPLHLCDAALLWTESGRAPATASATGPAPTRRSRCAAPPRPGRCSTGCSSCGCPTRSPSTPTSSSACSTHGVGALAARGVDVLWPRSLGRDLTARTVLDRSRPCPDRARSRCRRALRRRRAVRLPLAARAARRPAHRGGDGRSSPPAAAPILRLRGSWTVVDPAVARKARKRAGPHGHARPRRSPRR